MIRHTTFRNGKLFCSNCGGEHNLPYPLPVKELTDKIDAFNLLHKDCPKSWAGPTVDINKKENERALWWIANGERGLSSETMWNCFMGSKNFVVNYPYDPDDFKRCYKLLNTVPEWKTRMHELKSLCPQWNNLVNNWDKLTEMFEKNVREDWINYKEVGMYNFMQKLLKTG